MLEKTLESPLDSKETKSVNPKGNKPWIFIGRTDAEAPVLWPPDVKSQLLRKDPDAGKDWRQEEKGTTEYGMVERHHWLSEHEFDQTPGDGEGQGSLVCYSPWSHKESDTTEQLNNNKCLTMLLGDLRNYVTNFLLLYLKSPLYLQFLHHWSFLWGNNR